MGTVDGTEIYQGNGIPDVAEIALFYHILKSAHLNEANKANFVTPGVWVSGWSPKKGDGLRERDLVW